MTEPNWDGWFPDADFVDKTREAVHENLELTNQILAFKTGVHDMEHPLGALLQRLADAHSLYLIDELAGVVTQHEESRWRPVIKETVAVFEWLTEDQP